MFGAKSSELTLMSMNLCMGSYHCNRTMPDCRAPHRYLWPVYGFLTLRQTGKDRQQVQLDSTVDILCDLGISQNGLCDKNGSKEMFLVSCV